MSANTSKPNAYALVTGASKGLGKAFAQALAGRKHNLVLVARSSERLNTLAEELRASQNISVEAIAVDLSKPSAANELIQHLNERALRVNLLVNNAGFGLQGEFRILDLERQIEMIQLHNATVVGLTHLLLPSMIKERHGGIINVSSMAGMQAAPYATLYSATKAFLTTFSLALEREVGRFGIRVVTLCPGRLAKEPQELGQASRKKFAGAEQSVHVVVNQALKLLDNGGGLLIPGLVNKFANLAQRFFPRRLVAKGIGKVSRPKSK